MSSDGTGTYMKYLPRKSRPHHDGYRLSAAGSTVRVTAGAILLMLRVSSLTALDPSLSTTQYLHVSWTGEEGNALPAINALAQTTDGYLWLGTSTGLVRFDGM